MSSFFDRYRSLVIVGNARARNNEPLDDEAKRDIYGYLAAPSVTGWSNISGTMVNNRMLTLWQAVRQVDPTFPATGRRYEVETGRVMKEWERIPHPDLVLKAIQYAQSQNKPFLVESAPDAPEAANHRKSQSRDHSEQS
jgi:hypothetical protein